MDTSHAPIPHPLPTAVSQVLATYRPRALTEPQWTACRAEVVELVAAAPPADEADVRALLGSAVVLLAWAAPQVPQLRLVDVLTGPWVERFAAAWRQEGRSDNSLRNHLAALHRLQRTLAGEDGSRRINRTDRSGPRTTAPYGPVEFSAVRAAAAHAPRHLMDAISTTLTLHERGIVAPHAFEHGLDPAAWSEARRWMREHRLPPLDAAQLRRAWAFTVVQGTSLLEALKVGLRSDEIDGLRDHLPAHGNSSRTSFREF